MRTPKVVVPRRGAIQTDDGNRKLATDYTNFTNGHLVPSDALDPNAKAAKVAKIEGWIFPLRQERDVCRNRTHNLSAAP